MLKFAYFPIKRNVPNGENFRQVIFYSTQIFRDAKLSDRESQIGTIAMGSMNVVMTVISSILVEAAGRKTLLLAGFAGMTVDTILLAITLFISVRIYVLEPL